MKTTTKNLVISGLFIAAGIVLPIAFHSIPNSGSVLLPMHLPILLCGFICGWQYGLAAGLILPFLSSAVTGMPPLFPVAVSMALELAAYGFVSGILSKKADGASGMGVFTALTAAMLAGRIVMGIANFFLLGVSGKTYTMAAFISGAFVTALPGIAIQLILVPVIVIALKKTGFISR